jgi:hypothetical protein
MGPILEQGDHLALPCVPLQFRLLEHRSTVAHHLKPSARRGDQLDVGIRELAADLGRQPGGPWLIVSKRAVFDRDFHGCSTV